MLRDGSCDSCDSTFPSQKYPLALACPHFFRLVSVHYTEVRGSANSDFPFYSHSVSLFRWFALILSALFRSTEMVENFMTAWTVLVGDPVLSEWIVLVLAVAIMTALVFSVLAARLSSVISPFLLVLPAL